MLTPATHTIKMGATMTATNRVGIKTNITMTSTMTKEPRRPVNNPSTVMADMGE